MGGFALALERACQEEEETLTPVPYGRYQPITRPPHAPVPHRSYDSRQRALARERRLRGLSPQPLYASSRNTPPARYVSRREW